MHKIRFLHIPKTAGTAFSELLTSGYRKDQIVDISDKGFGEKFKQLSGSERRAICLVVGHGAMYSGMDEIDALPLVTFFREPVSRVESFCQHVWEGKSPQYWKVYPPMKFDIKNFLNDKSINELENGQTRLIVGENYYQNFFNSDDLIKRRVRDVLHNKLEFFGLTERYEESLLLLKKKFPDISIYSERRNVRNKKRSLKLSEDDYKFIMERNQLDIKTYEIAKELFLRRVEEFKNNGEIISLPKFKSKNFTKRKVDISLIQKALMKYFDVYHGFPISEKWDGYKSKWGKSSKEWIPALIPDFIDALPRDPRMSEDPRQQYLYKSDGDDYKIIVHTPEDYEFVEQNNFDLIDMHPSRRSYGVWTENAKYW